MNAFSPHNSCTSSHPLLLLCVCVLPALLLLLPVLLLLPSPPTRPLVTHNTRDHPSQGSGLSWLFPFVDGHPPIGWHDAGAYLVLPLLLVASQYASQKLVTPQTSDPSQQQTQAILGFLPFMIGELSQSDR